VTEETAIIMTLAVTIELSFLFLENNNQVMLGKIRYLNAIKLHKIFSIAIFEKKKIKL
jgi:hypothetical protein